MAIAWEVSRHPIEDHSQARLVTTVDKVHEIVRRAVTARRSVVADRLVAPAPRERVLGDRQQLQVRKAHVFGIRHKLMSQLAIREPAAVIVSRTAPASQVDFVARDRGV